MILFFEVVIFDYQRVIKSCNRSCRGVALLNHCLLFRLQLPSEKEGRAAFTQHRTTFQSQNQ